MVEVDNLLNNPLAPFYPDDGEREGKGKRVRKEGKVMVEKTVCEGDGHCCETRKNFF